MPASFEIISQTSTYPVEIKPHSVQKLVETNPQAHIIIDAALISYVKLLPTHKILTIEANEESKQFEAIADYIQTISEQRLNRKSIIIAIGGGVIQDIAGFISSIYMRGINWHYAPTTLLGMVDSCIGGKSSINLRTRKNLVGTYYPPLSVVVDPEFIKTLKAEQIADGLCEAAKICFAHPDKSVFESYLAMDKTKPGFYEELIELTLRTKKWFIEIDEFDQNERLLLNFGHTFGHAIESASNYSISHGVAVGIGILCAINFSPDKKAKREMQLEKHIRELLKDLPDLSAHIAALDVNKILSAFQFDKKHTVGEYAVIIPDQDSHLINYKLPRNKEFDITITNNISLALKSLRKG